SPGKARRAGAASSLHRRAARSPSGSRSPRRGGTWNRAMNLRRARSLSRNPETRRTRKMTAETTNDRRRWLALYVLCAGVLMIVIDATIVNVALPSIQDDLGFSQSNLAWVVNAYLIAFGGLLLLA